MMTGAFQQHRGVERGLPPAMHHVSCVTSSKRDAGTQWETFGRIWKPL